jgi:hypothetical protein
LISGEVNSSGKTERVCADATDAMKTTTRAVSVRMDSLLLFNCAQGIRSHIEGCQLDG